MSTVVHLRGWQHEALERFAATHDDFLAVATPGAGKTRFALAAVLNQLAGRPGRVVVTTPTRHLTEQWSAAAAGLGLRLSPEWVAAHGVPPRDVHGVVVTYQQVASDPVAVARVARGAVVVLDEVHHAGDERAWGDALRVAFADAARRLSLSGTPFRSDTQAIPFVRYAADEAVPDVEYGYDDALADGGVVRPVHFPRLDGVMEWTAPDGSHREASFAERLDRTAASQRLRTALSLDGDWLPSVLEQADRRLTAIRAAQPDAGGLVLAIDVEHARGIAALLGERLGRRAVVVTNDDVGASDRIAAFARGRQPWIVAVRMVSEGVDIPRLRVGVYATTTTTELFFRQAVGRLVRWTADEGEQTAWCYLPDDVRLRALAADIAATRRHVLRRRDDEDGDIGGEPRAARPVDGPEQPSLFAAISATPTRGLIEPATDGIVPDRARPATPVAAIALAPPPPLAGADTATGSGAPADAAGARGERSRLRAGNRDRAGAIATLTGWSHAKVNAELNRLAGVRSVTAATNAALHRRLDHADRWLARL